MTKRQPKASQPSGLVDLARERETPAKRRYQRLVDRLSVMCIATPGLSAAYLGACIPRVLERCELCTHRQLAAELDGRRGVTHGRWSMWRVVLERGARRERLHVCDAHAIVAIRQLLTLEHVRDVTERQLELCFADPGPIRLDLLDDALVEHHETRRGNRDFKGKNYAEREAKKPCEWPLSAHMMMQCLCYPCTARRIVQRKGGASHE